jgi:hypothetical protein
LHRSRPEHACKLKSTVEIEGEAKPAVVADLLCMLIGKEDAST